MSTSDALRLSWDRGRKRQSCEWCAEEIVRGEGHYRLRGFWGGERQDWRMHEECYEASQREPHTAAGFEPHTHNRGMTETETQREQRR